MVRQVASGEKRVAEVCQEHGVDERVLRRWRAEYAALGERAFLPRTAVAPVEVGHDSYVGELERFCGRLALENERLRRALETDSQGALIGNGHAANDHGRGAT
jgi:transposase-like protein